MEPAEWTAIAGGVSALASAGGFAVSAMRAGQTGAINTQLADQSAQIARDKAAADARDIEIQTRKAIASNRAQAGASGLLVDEGSPLEVSMFDAQQGETNRLRRLWQGELEARNAVIGGYASSVSAADKQFGAYTNAGSSLLTGASRIPDLFKTKPQSFDNVGDLISAKGLG